MTRGMKPVWNRVLLYTINTNKNNNANRTSTNHSAGERLPDTVGLILDRTLPYSQTRKPVLDPGRAKGDAERGGGKQGTEEDGKLYPTYETRVWNQGMKPWHETDDLPHRMKPGMKPICFATVWNQYETGYGTNCWFQAP